MPASEIASEIASAAVSVPSAASAISSDLDMPTCVPHVVEVVKTAFVCAHAPASDAVGPSPAHRRAQGFGAAKHTGRVSRVGVGGETQRGTEGQGGWVHGCRIECESSLEPFAPTLLWKAAECPALVHDVLLPAVRASASFCASAYFYARSQPRLFSLKEQMYAAAPVCEQRELAASDAFVNALLSVVDTFRRRGRAGSSAVMLPLHVAGSGNCNDKVGEMDGASAAHESRGDQHRDQHREHGEQGGGYKEEASQYGGAAIDQHIFDAQPRLPGSMRYRVLQVDCAAATELASYTRPWVVPCTLLDCCTGRQEARVLMVKNEAVFKDDVVQRIQQYLRHVDPSLALVPYVVTPVAPDRGIVLFLDKCESLASIQKKGTLLSYLLSHNQSATVGNVQQAFMRSCAASAVMSLLCGFGDRHLNNILVHGTSLVHVDFGYLFGEEPALSTACLTLPPQNVRLTKGMLEVFSGTHYDEFLSQCARVNRLARSVGPDLFCIAQALAPVGAITQDRLEAHFNQYMLPYTVTSNREADQFILSVVENDALASSSAGFRSVAGAVIECLFR